MFEEGYDKEQSTNITDEPRFCIKTNNISVSDFKNSEYNAFNHNSPQNVRKTDSNIRFKITIILLMIALPCSFAAGWYFHPHSVDDCSECKAIYSKAMEESSEKISFLQEESWDYRKQLYQAREDLSKLKEPGNASNNNELYDTGNDIDIDELFTDEIDYEEYDSDYYEYYDDFEDSDEEYYDDESLWSDSTTVYVTPHGKKYHRYYCKYVQGKQCSEYDIDYAESKGYSPCSVCF